MGLLASLPALAGRSVSHCATRLCIRSIKGGTEGGGGGIKRSPLDFPGFAAISDGFPAGFRLPCFGL